MDFPCPPELVRALQARASHPVYGYTYEWGDFSGILQKWYGEHYGVTLETRDLLLGPGAVPSLGIAVRAFTRPGDGVLLFSPVYTPFYDMIRHNGREVVAVPLKMDDRGRYHFDRETPERALEKADAEGRRVPLGLFCSPHNPGGRVWDRGELETLLDFAESRGMILLADEIHGDFVYPPRQFTSLAALPEYARRTVVVSSASKSFNLGGLRVSHFIIRDRQLQQAIRQELRGMGFHYPDIFSMIAARTAYGECAAWLGELKTYLAGNIHQAVERLNTGDAGIRAYTPEGTYLIWADASSLIARAGLKDDTELAGLLEREGRVKITPGSSFGPGGGGFVRINAACPRSQLLEGLDRLKSWIACSRTSSTTAS
jgi:cystathionine beta-lyase